MQAENDFFVNVKTIEQLNEKLISYLKGSVSFPDAELCEAANSFFNKLKIGDAYQPATKLNGEVLLFKAQDNFVSMGNDYGLKEVNSSMMYLTRGIVSGR